MAKNEIFEYNCFGSTYKVQFAVGRYGNGNLALEMMGAEGTEDEGEPIVRVTVNPDIPLPDTQIAIKDYSENEGMVDFCKKIGIIGKLVRTIPSGFVEIPVYELTESGLEIFKD